MNKDEALKMALEEYLCREMPAGTIIGDPKWWVSKIANAIKKALAQPEQHQDWCASLTQMLMSMPPKPAPCNCKPPQRKPLTDEEILQTAHKRHARINNNIGNDLLLISFARAIEAAHGIKGEA